MKKLVLTLSLFLGFAAQADQIPAWKQQLEQYKTDITQATPFGLRMRQGFYAGAAVTTCTLSTAVTASAFVTDTLPVANVVSETIANISNMDYQTYQNILEWENLGSIGRGIVGGGAVGVVESLEFVVKWLGGNEAQSFEALKKTYASSIATMDAMFADQSKCMMSISKVLITTAEIKRRAQLPSPMRVPSDLVRP